MPKDLSGSSMLTVRSEATSLTVRGSLTSMISAYDFASLDTTAELDIEEPAVFLNVSKVSVRGHKWIRVSKTCVCRVDDVKVIPRPFEKASHGKARNLVLNLDFISITSPQIPSLSKSMF